jgi:anti-sigma factor RsiW
MANCERFGTLLSGLLDGELTAEETVAVNDHLIRCASCRADYEELRKAEPKLAAVAFAEITDEAAKRFWRLPYSRALRNSALFMIVAGYAALLAVAFFSFLAGDENLFAKIVGAAIVIGVVLLLGMLIVERIVTYRVDPYKEIER